MDHKDGVAQPVTVSDDLFSGVADSLSEAELLEIDEAVEALYLLIEPSPG